MNGQCGLTKNVPQSKHTRMSMDGGKNKQYVLAQPWRIALAKQIKILIYRTYLKKKKRTNGDRLKTNSVLYLTFDDHRSFFIFDIFMN